MMLLNMMIQGTLITFKMTQSKCTFFANFIFFILLCYVFRLVVRRKSNKAFIKLIVKPRDDLSLGTEVVTGFIMQHVYTNTIATTVENKEPQKYDHNIKVFINLGVLVGSE